MSAQTPGLAQGVANMPVLQRSLSASRSPGRTTDTVHSPISPSLPRRSSSQLQRPGSAASPRLQRKTSRSSLGAPSNAQDEAPHRPTPKRSISNLITELRGAQATMEAIPEPVVLTAPEIAIECFQKELARHEDIDSEAVVLLHDSCYGHRFARLKTSKGSLSMIVERPERLLASVLGVATTYVRMGGYHAGARNAPAPKMSVSTAPPFSIRRTARNLDLKSTYVTNVHGFEWMTELDGMCNLAEKKLQACEKEVARLPSAFSDDKRTLHEGDLYLCEESLNAFQGALGGVADAIDAVFQRGTSTSRAFVAIRPPGHHCSADHPSGFCWINNVHVGIEYAAQTYDLTHAAIIDFDLHHGDGSQAITWQRNSKNHSKRLYPKSFTKTKMAPDIGYYSLHDINSYPCEMGDDEKIQAASLCIHNAHGQSIWNVHLQPWKTIDEFWALYESRYTVLLEKATDFLKFHTSRILIEGKQKPMAAIFISAGFDASEWEGEGMQRHKVNVPTEFYARFTEDIMKVAQADGTSCEGRVISVLEGGYSDRALCSSTMSHLSALCATTPKNASSGLGNSMLNKGNIDEQLRKLSLTTTSYEASWWSAKNLTALEHHVNPPPPNAGGKKVRGGPHPTYATPTESFAYKVIDPAKFARSVSGTFREGAVPTRPATPPPPEVDWIVAAHELSKLLIPTNRSTRSHTAESLAGSKVKKERASSAELMTSPEEAGKPRQLRTRTKPIAQTPQHNSKRNVSGADRRKTMGDFSSLIADNGPMPTSRRPSRRSSMASTVSDMSMLPDTVPPVPAMPTQRVVAAPATTGDVKMKKTRPAAAATPAKARRPAITTARSANDERDATEYALSSASAETPDRALPDNNVDALASGMKRVTLKVGSREENDRKAKEKLDADRRARALKGAETRRINKAAKDAKAAQEKMNVASPVAMDTPTYPAAPQSQQQSVPAQIHMQPQPQQQVMYNQGFAPQPQQQTAPPTFAPPAPYLYGTSTAVIQEHGNYAPPRQVLTPDPTTGQLPTAYTPQGVPIQQLPVFSSTGHIPFANNAYPNPHQQAPVNALQYPTQQALPQINYTAPLQYDQGQPHQQAYRQDMPDMHEHDVWAVPDTPAKQMYDPKR